MKKIYAFLIIAFAAFAVQAQVTETMNFNDYEEGGLCGQDAWYTKNLWGEYHDWQITESINGIDSYDGTKAAFLPPIAGATFGTRIADDNFNINFTYGDTAIVTFSTRNMFYATSFSIGHDIDGDSIAEGAISFYMNTLYSAKSISLPNGATVGFSLPYGNDLDWHKYKLFLDFSAYDGEGSLSMTYCEDPNGSDWQDVMEIQGLNMGLEENSGTHTDRATWDAITIFTGVGSWGHTGGYDDIILNYPAGPSGTLQFISFPAIPDMMNTAEPFEITATSTSGLPVLLEVTEGPATINGNIVTLTGDGGFVTIKASQAGNDIYEPATSIYNVFEVVDPADFPAEITIRRPAEGPNVYMNELSPIIIVASTRIEHPEFLSVNSVSCEIDGETFSLTEKSWGTGYYSSDWTPPAYGTYSMTITAIITGDVVSTETITFEVVDNPADFSVHAFDHVHISSSTTQNVILDVVFPTFVGSFDEVMVYFNVTCPPLGCDPWDRVGAITIRNPNGEWVEILRYITPYGVPCEHQLDVTDYVSLFQGNVEMELAIGTSNDGFVVDVVLDFKEGTPEYKYSWIDPIWSGWYYFGDYANLQPVDTILWNFEETVETSKLKIVNTGHGWGDANTGNAAEFYNATHHIKINDDSFPQHLWIDCNPNPDGCQPQNGTWYYNRAGWCPGSVGHVFEYDMTPYVNLPDVQMVYEFDLGYVDYCHPNHPDCVTGVTCWDCDQGFNPIYFVEGNLISYSNSLYIPVGEKENDYFGIKLSPNPAVDFVQLSTSKKNASLKARVQIFNPSGQLIQQFEWNGETRNVDISALAQGIYVFTITSAGRVETKKLIVQ